MKAKRVLAMLLVISSLVTMLSAFGLSAQAASISSNKHTATGIKGGQTVFITTNTGWNYWMPWYTTKLTITIPSDFKDEYQNGRRKTDMNAGIQVIVYKKTNGNWKTQSSGIYYCDRWSGQLNSIKLSGNGIQYKITIRPQTTGSVHFASDVTGIKAQINYGKITSVS